MRNIFFPHYLSGEPIFSLYEMFVYAFIGIILCVLNLIVMHMIVKRHSQ